MDKQFIRKRVTGVKLGLYDDESVRQRSAIEITSPQAFDSLGEVLPRGLYDELLGPIGEGKFGRCETCAKPSQQCLGHCGHIELCVPCYHPLLFPMLIKLLRSKCLSCHSLKIGSYLVQMYEIQLRFINAGLIYKSEEIHDREPWLKKNIDEGKLYLKEKLKELEYHEKKNKRSKKQIYLNAHERQIKNERVKAVLSECTTAPKCMECMAISPRVKQVNHNKVFMDKISTRSHTSNLEHGVEFKAIDGDQDFDEGTDYHKSQKFMHALQVEAQSRETWKKHPYLCSQLFGTAMTTEDDKTNGYNMFFMRAICVPPSRFRPAEKQGDYAVEHGQNVNLSKIISVNTDLRTVFAQYAQMGRNINNEEQSAELSEEDVSIMQIKYQSRALEVWVTLQTQVNIFLDNSKDPNRYGLKIPGVRQLLEKKEGMFRKHMMGKRVNFACRSVISPDPYIGTNEIGIPLRFANTLTFPESVSQHNKDELRQLIVNGSKNYPGANYVEDTATDTKYDLSRMDAHRRTVLADKLLNGEKIVIVGRHLKNGDMLLVNRQPTLHKPGIMGHKARILLNPNYQTIRMHYANCNTYNADFDGDEMNCHFPQNTIADAESRFLACTDEQYIVPTDGSPLRGLIQDHVDSGVKLCNKDTFLTRDRYQQLVFHALCGMDGVDLIPNDMDIGMVPPAIRKPKELWTGKQVISTILLHLSPGNFSKNGQSKVRGISFERKAKTPAWAFGEAVYEHLVLIKDGELLRGVLDKAAFGATSFSLIHAVHEVYGSTKAGLLLNSFSRIFTFYLQSYAGHSCRLEDLVLTKKADEERRRKVEEATAIGCRAAKAWADSDGGKVKIPPIESFNNVDQPLNPSEFANTRAKIGDLLSGKDRLYNSMSLDGYMQSQLNPLASNIVKICLPDGLAVPFPDNTFSLMVNTGAKGSTVNQSQVSCALGQQSLEGRRVPRMSSGRTLPSFAPFDPTPRADGFITDRFLTGIKPQEYYFHCMAGREGLVDTAVKTSRSGYLQRCLVKHLEDLKVCYDYTVRDSENCVVQFLYGEDGIDATKASYLDLSPSTISFFAKNYDAVRDKYHPLPRSTLTVAKSDAATVKQFQKDSSCSELLRLNHYVQARKLRVGTRWEKGNLCQDWFNAKIIKCYPDNEFFDIVYVDDNSTAAHVPKELSVKIFFNNVFGKTDANLTIIRPLCPDPVLSDSLRKHHRIGTSGSCVSEKVASDAFNAIAHDSEVKQAMKAYNISVNQIDSLLASRYSNSFCAPGEAVGCIAAQSIGEPSTQMTLNTFHLAGSGANLTLGVPRLREILMTASRNLKTPTMSIPFKPSVSEEDMTLIARKLSKLTLMELIASHKGISITESIEKGDTGRWERSYYIALKLHPQERIRAAFGLSTLDIINSISKFIGILTKAMKDQMKRSGADHTLVSAGNSGRNDLAEDELEEDGNNKSKSKKRNIDDEYDDEQVFDEDGVMGSRFGHKKEMVSYGEMDEEDEAIAHENDDMDNTTMMNGEDNAANEVIEISDEEGDTKDTNVLSYGNIKIGKKTETLYLPPLRVDPSNQPLLMVTLVEQAATKTVVQQKKGIDQAFVNDEDGRGKCLQIAGVNLNHIWKQDANIVDHNELMSNDTWALCTTYGVEAARKNIVFQIRAVFGVYGIEIDTRHLNLIADYMTFNGGYRAMNRKGMAEKESSFLKMSFESTVAYLMDAAAHNHRDELTSPSGSVVLGNPMMFGTGAFDCIVKA